MQYLEAREKRAKLAAALKTELAKLRADYQVAAERLKTKLEVDRAALIAKYRGAEEAISDSYAAYHTEDAKAERSEAKRRQRIALSKLHSDPFYFPGGTKREDCEQLVADAGLGWRFVPDKAGWYATRKPK